MNNSSLPTLTLGLDLGDRRHSFCLIDAETRILEEASVANSSEALAALPERFPQAAETASLPIRSGYIPLSTIPRSIRRIRAIRG